MDPNVPVPQGESISSNQPGEPEVQVSVPLEETTNVISPSEPMTQPTPQPPMPETPAPSVIPSPPSDQPPTPPMEQNSTDEAPKKSSPLIVVAIIILLLTILGAGGYLLWTKYFAVSTPTPTPSPSPVAVVTATPTADPTANWETYTNTAVGFSVRYPSDWRLVGTETSADTIGFGPSSVGEDVQWVINIYNNKTADQIIADMGKQFGTDRKVQQEKITISGLPATKVTVTTSSLATWVLEQIMINSDNKIIAISNGAIVDSNFDSFYESFKFTEATATASPKASSTSSPSATIKP